MNNYYYRTKSIIIMSESDKIMNEISNKYNPKSVEEGANILNSALMTGDSSSIMAPIINGANEFEQRMGRPMTYSEMRSMFG